jgi:hypothetical protein
MRRALLAPVAALLGCAAPAYAAGTAALPSPLAPLSSDPPLTGGATAATGNPRHRVAARTTVHVSLDPTGAPFAIAATQRLRVAGSGDYLFTIGAPLLDVTATPDSAAEPVLRTDAIVWQGFAPDTEVLGARAALDPGRVRDLLPLRVVPHGGRVTLVNATAVTAGAYTASVPRRPLLAYLAGLRSDLATSRPLRTGSVPIASQPRRVRMRVSAPLLVTGMIGSHRVSLVVRDRTVVRAAGRVDLTVVPLERVETGATARLGGRELLHVVSRAVLTLARARQYAAFLGNPDPTGPTETSYVYRTAGRPTPAQPAALVVHDDHRLLTLVLVAFGIVVALGGAALAWSRRASNSRPRRA